MKNVRYLSVLAGLAMLLTAAAGAQIKWPPFFGTTPSNSVAHWINYAVLGPRNMPFPSVWMSPQRFKTSGYPEFLIVLPPLKYAVVAIFTQYRIARYNCAGGEPQRPPWYTLQVSEHDDGRTQTCVMLQTSACHYLSDVLHLPIDWSLKERQPIVDLAHSIKCKDV